MLRKILATAATAAASIGLAAAPAGALINADWAGDTPESRAVVRLAIAADGGVAECTGTVISSQWVLTAKHCIEDSNRKAGFVLTGQGRDTQRFAINDWVGADSGDTALIHVTEPFNVDPAPIDGATVPVGAQVQAYGWSSLGQGATGKLPTAPVTVVEHGQQEEYGNELAYMTRSTLPTLLQRGDSGGPIFRDGRVVGTLSMGISYNLLPPTVTGLYVHGALTPEKVAWIRSVTGTNPSQPAPEIPGEQPTPIPLPSLTDIIGSFGSVDIESLLPGSVQGSLATR